MAIADIEQTITGQNTLAQTYAANAIEQVNSATEALSEAIGDVNPNYQLGWLTLGSPQWQALAQVVGADKPGDLDLGAAGGLLNTDLTRPGVYTPGTINAVDPLNFQEFSGSAPALDLPSRPDSGTFTLPVAEAVNLPTIPSAPDYTLPTAPTLAALTLPDAPDFAPLTPFALDTPTFLVEAPGATLAYNESTYVSALQTAVVAWLQDKVLNGGTGIAPAVEQAIWDRGMTRETTAARRNLENAVDEFTSFPMPPGALRARMREIRADLQNRGEDLSRKISEDQANLAQKNTQFAIDATLRLEALTMQHFHNVAERTLRYAQATADLALAVFNARVAEFNVRLDVYKSAAQVYEINVRAALQEVEIYKAVLQGKQIEGSLRQQEVDLYRAQLSGVEALFGLYRSQLEGVKAEGDIERLKLDVYRAQMDGFVSVVRAKEAEFGAFRAGIEGEKARVDAFDSEVRAYTAQAQAKSAFVDAQKTVVEAQVAVERGKIEQVRIGSEVYRADIERNKAAIDAVISKYRAENETYRSELGRAEAEGRLGLEGLRIEYQVQLANMQEINAKFRREADILLAMTQAGIGATTSAAQIQGDIAKAALSQVNTMTQLAGSFETVEEGV